MFPCLVAPIFALQQKWAVEIPHKRLCIELEYWKMDRIVSKTTCKFLSGGIKSTHTTARTCKRCSINYSITDFVLLVFWGVRVSSWTCCSEGRYKIKILKSHHLWAFAFPIDMWAYRSHWELGTSRHSVWRFLSTWSQSACPLYHSQNHGSQSITMNFILNVRGKKGYNVCFPLVTPPGVANDFLLTTEHTFVWLAPWVLIAGPFKGRICFG